MALHREDEERFAEWMNHFGLSEAEFGERAVSNPDALHQLRAGTAAPDTLIRLYAHVKANKTGHPAIDGWRA